MTASAFQQQQPTLDFKFTGLVRSPWQRTWLVMYIWMYMYVYVLYCSITVCIIFLQLLYLLSGHHWYRGNRYLIGQFSHVIPRQPPIAVFKAAKQTPVGLQPVVLQWMHTKHIFTKQLHVMWNRVRELGSQLLYGTKRWVTGFCCHGPREDLQYTYVYVDH